MAVCGVRQMVPTALPVYTHYVQCASVQNALPKCPEWWFFALVGDDDCRVSSLTRYTSGAGRERCFVPHQQEVFSYRGLLPLYKLMD